MTNLETATIMEASIETANSLTGRTHIIKRKTRDLKHENLHFLADISLEYVGNDRSTRGEPEQRLLLKSPLLLPIGRSSAAYSYPAG